LRKKKRREERDRKGNKEDEVYYDGNKSAGFTRQARQNGVNYGCKEKEKRLHKREQSEVGKKSDDRDDEAESGGAACVEAHLE